MKKTQKSKKSSFGLMPFGDRIVVRESKTSEGKKTDSGIYIPDGAKEEKGMKRGVVVAVGSGRMEDGKRIPIEASVGDTVLFHWGELAVVDGEEYFLVREGEVAGKIQ